MSFEERTEDAKPAILEALSQSDCAARRRCVCCAKEYAIADAFPGDQYFPRPVNYVDGCVTHCLACWLGVGPEGEPDLGNVLRDLAGRLSPTTHIALLPIIRVELSDPIRFNAGTVFYPKGAADLTGLQIALPTDFPHSLSMHQAAASGVDLATIVQHATVAFVASFDWAAAMNTSHEAHMVLLRDLSNWVDETCLNLVRYRLCSLTHADALPGRAGQLYSNPMMAGMVLYNVGKREGRLIGGSAFTHIIVRGLGLDLEPITEDEAPEEGEVGWIARRALALYRTALESDDQSSKFMQAVALLDFLAAPSDYLNSADIARKLVPYIAKTGAEYDKLRERFLVLHGKREGERHIGIRTRIVHLGERLEKIEPDATARKALFKELDSYIGPIVDHMIRHSALTWADYLKVRKGLGPYSETSQPSTNQEQ